MSLLKPCFITKEKARYVSIISVLFSLSKYVYVTTGYLSSKLICTSNSFLVELLEEGPKFYTFDVTNIIPAC